MRPETRDIVTQECKAASRSKPEPAHTEFLVLCAKCVSRYCVKTNRGDDWVLSDAKIKGSHRICARTSFLPD